MNPDWTVLSTRAMQEAELSRSQQIHMFFTWFRILLVGLSLLIGFLFCLHENTLAQMNWAILMMTGMTKRQLFLLDALRCIKESLLLLAFLWFDPILWIQALALMIIRVSGLGIALWRLDCLGCLRGKQKSSH